jgi:hypothetical protein
MYAKWARRCTKYIFISDKFDNTLPGSMQFEPTGMKIVCCLNPMFFFYQSLKSAHFFVIIYKNKNKNKNQTASVINFMQKRGQKHVALSNTELRKTYCSKTA